MSGVLDVERVLGITHALAIQIYNQKLSHGVMLNTRHRHILHSLSSRPHSHLVNDYVELVQNDSICWLYAFVRNAHLAVECERPISVELGCTYVRLQYDVVLERFQVVWQSVVDFFYTNGRFLMFQK